MAISTGKHKKHVFRKPLHYWTSEERQLIQDNIDKTAKWMKRNIPEFRSDRTISANSLRTQIYNIKKESGLKRTFGKNKQIKIGNGSNIQSVYFKFSKLESRHKEFEKQLIEKVESVSNPIHDEVRQELEEAIRKVMNKSMEIHHRTLVQELNIN